MGSIICSLLRSKMKEQQSNYQVLADPKHILQILFCSEQWEFTGNNGNQALACTSFHFGMAIVFWKHQTALQWLKMQPRLWHDLQRKFLESDRLQSLVHQRTVLGNINFCTPPQALSVPRGWLSQGAAIYPASCSVGDCEHSPVITQNNQNVAPLN